MQANEYGLEKKPDGEVIGAHELLLDVVTRWSSTYFMLERGVKLRKGDCVTYLYDVCHPIDIRETGSQFHMLT